VVDAEISPRVAHFKVFCVRQPALINLPVGNKQTTAMTGPPSLLTLTETETNLAETSAFRVGLPLRGSPRSLSTLRNVTGGPNQIRFLGPGRTIERTFDTIAPINTKVAVS